MVYWELTFKTELENIANVLENLCIFLEYLFCYIKLKEEEKTKKKTIIALMFNAVQWFYLESLCP